MATESPSSKDILKDLHEIYLRALEKAQYSVAFKIKELLGREAGLFAPRNNPPEKAKISLDGPAPYVGPDRLRKPGILLPFQRGAVVLEASKLLRC